MSAKQRQQHRRDISTSSLIAIFPLQGAYPRLAVSVLLRNHDQACVAADTPGVDTSTPSDARWTSDLHWVNEDNVDFMSVFDSDAYGDFLDHDNDCAREAYARRMSGAHFALFEDIWKDGGQNPSDRKFRRLSLPGSMVRQHEDPEVWELSELTGNASETRKARVEDWVDSQQRGGT